jgi:hypothetical protein
MKPGDLVRYRKLREDDENETTWNRIKDLTGIVFSPDEDEREYHVRILWNTGEIHKHYIPPYDPELHFEVIS